MTVLDGDDGDGELPAGHRLGDLQFGAGGSTDELAALDSAHQDHEAILRALQAHDAPLAISAATVHIAAVEQWLATSLIDDTMDG